METESDAVVREEPEHHRYVLEVGGERVGVLEYQREQTRIALLHAETSAEHAGQGLAGVLTRHVLDAARADGLEVLPLCPYVAAWIRKHPEYADLVPVAERARFRLED